jgi:hypothetical protein
LLPDREGLVAAVHNVITYGDALAEPLYGLAHELADRLNRRVWYVMTESRWHLLLLALDDGGYGHGEEGGGSHSRDEFTGYFDPGNPDFKIMSIS